ncbi:fas apoptotic inhibitory molecule 1 [Aplysia californica]|uniref:Fas apoptotic inhibitory molecule 1 n=1 Tax=Aplysia californica TaxID=6500 RepID=A0ABM0JYP3_APLCA|nr:fas apoptotic inhibitory molecule 1 [Aplysia californica]
MSDLVATWDIALSDGVHKVEFEHGTTSGKRIIRVDGKEIYRQDWMFKLVGKEYFQVSKAKCCISIDAVSGFAYEYTLDVNGKPLKKFQENQSKIMKCWVLYLGGNDVRVVLEKDTLDVWVNGRIVETAGEFADDGTETHFEIGSHSAYIKAITTGKRRDGIVHQLFVDEVEIPLATD